MKKPVRFKVFLDKVHFLVYVWPTKTALLHHRKNVGRLKGRCEAYTFTYAKRQGRCIGEIHFSYNWLKDYRTAACIIAHECTHAALSFFRLAEEDFNQLNEWKSKVRQNDMEEALAYAVDNMVFQIFNKTTKSKLIH